MKCVKCNSELPDGAKFCNACGALQEAPQVPPPVQQQFPPQYAQMPQQQYAPAAPQVPAGPQKSRTAYQILALLFGGLGIHNFYAGYVGRGIAQLLLCWTGISGIWALIEVFVVSKDAKGVPMKPSKLALILLIIILIFGIGGALYGCRGRILYLIFSARENGGSGAGDALSLAARREEVKANVVGKYLKAKAGGKKTVVVCNFGTKESILGKTFIKAFKNSYGDATEVELRENPDGGTGESVPLKDVKEALDAHKDAELIVFYGGTLPTEYHSLGLGANVKIFLFEQGAAPTKKIKSDINAGKIIGILMSRIGKDLPKSREPIENDDQKAFDRRYVIIDKENIAAKAEYLQE